MMFKCSFLDVMVVLVAVLVGSSSQDAIECVRILVIVGTSQNSPA